MVLLFPPRPIVRRIDVDRLVRPAVMFPIGLRISGEIDFSRLDCFASYRTLADRGKNLLAVPFADVFGQRDIDRNHMERTRAHQITPKSPAVRSMHSLALASIFSTSASLMMSGGDSTMVSRMARITSPFSKQ